MASGYMCVGQGEKFIVFVSTLVGFIGYSLEQANRDVVVLLVCCWL